MPNDNDRGHLWFWYAIAVVVLLLDQLTKTAIMRHFVYGDSLSISAYFNVVRVHNAGAAFSFFERCGRLAALGAEWTGSAYQRGYGCLDRSLVESTMARTIGIGADFRGCAGQPLGSINAWLRCRFFGFSLVGATFPGF